MKECSVCERFLSLTEFTLRRNGYHFLQCKECRAEEHRVKRRQWKLDNPDKVKSDGRKYHLKKRYGLTPEEYDIMLAEQGGNCAICPATEPGNGRKYFAVDHDHQCCPGDKTCGKCIRGLLCSNCNTALGMLQDNPETVESLLQYLLKGGWHG